MDLAKVMREVREHALEEAATLIESLAYEMSVSGFGKGRITRVLAEKIRQLKAQEVEESTL